MSANTMARSDSALDLQATGTAATAAAAAPQPPSSSQHQRPSDEEAMAAQIRTMENYVQMQRDEVVRLLVEQAARLGQSFDPSSINWSEI